MLHVILVSELGGANLNSCLLDVALSKSSGPDFAMLKAQELHLRVNLCSGAGVSFGSSCFASCTDGYYAAAERWTCGTSVCRVIGCS